MGNMLRILHKALLLSRDARFRRALRQGVGAAIEHRGLLRSLCNAEIGTVVDVGANVGQFTLLARHLFPAASVIAFEPLARECRKFQAVHGVDGRVRLVPVAVGPLRDEVSMHVSGARDSSSLLPITEQQSLFFPGTAESHRETVRMAPLSAMVEPGELVGTVLLKLDVQGFELPALRGCEELLHRIAFVYVECSFVELYRGQALAGELVAWLGERGFRLAGIGPVTTIREGVAVQADLLFHRSVPEGLESGE